MHTYEIEIKSLLGSKENADALRKKLQEVDQACSLLGKNTQLNHYFVGGVVQALFEKTAELFSKEEQARFQKIVTEGKNTSVRTRDTDGTVLLVVKASIDDTSSENGITRIEFESKVALSLKELDAKVLEAGYTYQAKWSREREEYLVQGAHITIDRNAGYGYLAEFEKVVDDPARAEEVRAELRALMEQVGVVELPQDRLERMFAHYNAHWDEYYGTEKIFTIL